VVTVYRLPTVCALFVFLVTSVGLMACDVNHPDSNEAPVAGGYSLSVYNRSGLPARKVPPKLSIEATPASAHEIAEGGSAADPNQLFNVTTSSGRMQMLYIRIAFPDDTREWISKDVAYEDCRGVADYFAENSYGALQISSDVTPLLMMPHSYLYYREYPLHVSIAGATPLYDDALIVAQAAGYNPANYDVRAIAHRTMFSASSSNIQVQGKGWAVLAHELGHVLGAGHSLRWQADGTSAHGARDWRRFGLGTITNLYNDQVVAYGDPWCLMGGGEGHYSIYWKLAMKWLPQAQVPHITSSGRYRITALDYPTLDHDRTYGFSVTRNNQQTYYAGYRLRQVDGRSVRFPLPVETWLPDSLLIWGGPWDGSREKNTPPDPGPYLIDTTPGSPTSLTATVGTTAPIDGGNLDDVGIQVGRTWSDSAAGIHITVVDRVRTEPEALDVVVNLGTFPDNHKPTVTLTATGGTLSDTGQYLVTHVAGSSTPDIGFQAVATDPDGDELAYFWDFGDVTNSSVNSSLTTHAWTDATAGTGRLLTVRVVVSDMKGGVASAILPINIGLSEFPALDVSDTTQRQVLWAKGRILDQAGDPVEGMRVTWIGTPWRGTFTDSDGRYWLGQIPNGLHSFEARSESLYSVGINDAAPLPSPVRFSLRDLAQVDFIAYKRQTVTVATSTPTVAPGATASFTLTRSFATSGTFSRPAPYTITDLTAAPTPPLYVRLYHSNAYADASGNLLEGPDMNAELTWEWRPVTTPATAWQALPVFKNILFQTPEDWRQDRRETQIVTNPPNPDPSPIEDWYVQFPVDVDAVEVRCSVGSSVPVWQREVSLMVAHSPDYYADVNQSAVIVANPAPAATPTVALTVSPGTIVEGSGEAMLVQVQTTVPAPTRISIPLAISGAATSRLTTLPAFLVIEPGGTSASCQLFGIDDTLVQGTETASVTISAGAGYNLGTSSASLSVVDNDRQRVWITNTLNPAREDNGAGAVVAGRFVVHRSGNLAGALVVRLVTSGTATAGVDYTMPSTVTIPAGLASIEVAVTPVADSDIEGDETVVATIDQTNDVRVVNPGAATCVIQDMAVSDVTITGGGTVTEGGSVNVTFTRNRVTAGSPELIVRFELSGTASYASNDYDIPLMSAYGRITIPAGQASLTVQVTAANDLVREITNEDSEYVFIQLSRSVSYNVVSGHDQATVTITDNDSTQSAEVTMEVPTYTVREGDSFDIDIVWSDWPTEPSDLAHPNPALYASVEYEVITDATGSNPAIAGTHFVGVATTVVTNTRVAVFASQERRVHLTIDTIHDGIYSTDRTFLVRLKNPVNCNLPQIRAGSANLGQCVVTIKDIDNGVVSLTAPTPTAVSGPPAVSGLLNLTRTITAPGPNNALKVILELSGNAVAGQDFTQIGSDAVNASYGGDVTMLRQVTIPAGILSYDIAIDPLDATTERLTRDLRVRVVQAAGYDYNSSAYSTVDITNAASDTRPYVSIAATQPVAYETGSTSMRFTLTRTGSTATALTVPVVLSSLSNAIAADFTTVPLSATIPAGSASTVVSLQAVNDGALEGTETAIMAIVVNATSSFRMGGSGSATGWVVDSSMPKPVVEVETVTATVLEEDDEAGIPVGSGAVGKLRLRRSGEQAYPLTVTLTRTGTATLGTDCASIASTAVIPAGATTVDIEVDPVQDAVAEGDETVIVTVASGTTYTAKIGFATGTVTIIDDDAASVDIAWQADGVEGGAAASFLLTRTSSDISAGLTVDVALTGTINTVAPDADLTAGAATVQATFAPGSATAVLSLPVVDDALTEVDESVIATVQAGAGCFPGTVPTAQAMILDNDQPRISVALAGAGPDADLAYENVSGAPVAASIRFTRTLTSGALSVDYSVSGTATSGSDYDSLTGTVDFADGVASVDVPVTPFDDMLVEENETVIVTLDTDLTYNIDAVASTTTVTIVSDDAVRVGVVSAANYLRGSTFGGSLSFRFYRLGSTVGPLRVNYLFGGDLVEGVDFLDMPGVIDILDGQDHVDLTITLAPGYDASTRKTLTCTVDNPVIVGSYVPGTVPGIAGGLIASTIQILKTGDTNLVRLRATVAGTVEGSLTKAVLTFEASNALATSEDLDVTRIPGLSTALAGAAPAGDYVLNPSPANLVAGETATTADLSGEADYLDLEGTEYVLLALDQPVAAGPGDPPFWSVGLPALFSIANSVPPQPDIVVRLGSSTGIDIGATDSMNGTQKTGTTFLRTYTIVNTGTLPLTITSIVLDPALPPVNCVASLLPAPVTPIVLNSGQETSFNVSINPTAFGVWSVGFRIDSDDPDEDPVISRIYGVGGSTTSSGTSSGSMVGTGDSGGCGAGGMAGLLIGLGLFLAGVRRATRRAA
jgi:hypothetical protein